MREFNLLIGGKLIRGASTLEVINPATEEILATAPRADHVQLDLADLIDVLARQATT